MSRKPLILILGNLLLGGGAMYADDFYFPGNGGGSVVWGNVYVNPYTAFDDSVSSTTALTIFCDDWNTEFYPPASWDATIYSLSAAVAPGSPTLTDLAFGNITQDYLVSFDNSSHQLVLTSQAVSSSAQVAELYKEEAWLDSQYSLLAPGDSVGQEELAAAGWTLFVDSTNVGGLVSMINNSGSSFANGVYTDLVNAQNNAPTFDTSGWNVITPLVPDPTPGDTSPMQEFLVYTPTTTGHTSTPEPGAIFLLATVAAGVGFKLRGRLRA